MTRIREEEDLVLIIWRICRCCFVAAVVANSDDDDDDDVSGYHGDDDDAVFVDSQDAAPAQLQLEFKCFLIDHKTNKHVPVSFYFFLLYSNVLQSF